MVDTDPSKPVSINVTINTNVSLSASNRVEHSPIAFALLFGIGLIGLASRRRLSGHRLLLTLTCCILLSGATLGLSSCSSNSATATNSNSTTTPSGSYTVSITAQQVGSITVLGNTGTPITLYGNLNQVSLPYTLEVTVQ
jgi:hypothetical protein